jgi:hypothetical protein
VGKTADGRREEGGMDDVATDYSMARHIGHVDEPEETTHLTRQLEW